MVRIYDKAKYHYEGDFPEGLPQSQAYVHIGMFLGWLSNEDLMNDEITADFSLEIDQFKRRQITCPVMLRQLGGVLASDMLTEMGNSFAQDYYESGSYFEDYIDVLSSQLESIYQVEDTWENFERISEAIGERYVRWKNEERV